VRAVSTATGALPRANGFLLVLGAICMCLPCSTVAARRMYEPPGGRVATLDPAVSYPSASGARVNASAQAMGLAPGRARDELSATGTGRTWCPRPYGRCSTVCE
jgi:hypothetical protein